MKKAIVFWDDKYHPATEIEDALPLALPLNEWEVTATKDPAHLHALPEDLNLLIFFANRAPDGLPEGQWHPDSVQNMWLSRIREGLGALFIHSGLTTYPFDSILHKSIAHGRFIQHPKHCQTRFDPIPALADHPILRGVSGFAAEDEHYFCAVDTNDVLPLAYATSQHGTTLAAWTHTLGKGRVACACPGHFKAVLNRPEMIRLMGNMAQYASSPEA